MATEQNPTVGAKLEITKCAMFVRMIEVNPALQAVQEQQMIDGAITKYPFRRVKDRMHVLPAGIQTTTVTVEQWYTNWQTLRN